MHVCFVFAVRAVEEGCVKSGSSGVWMQGLCEMAAVVREETGAILTLWSIIYFSP